MSGVCSPMLKHETLPRSRCARRAPETRYARKGLSSRREVWLDPGGVLSQTPLFLALAHDLGVIPAPGRESRRSLGSRDTRPVKWK